MSTIVSDETGKIKSVTRVEENGSIVLRLVVDFFDGHCPAIKFSDIEHTPVRIVPVRD